MLKTNLYITIFTVLFLTGSIAHPVGAATQASYLYRLSDFSGPVPSLWAKVDVSKGDDEVYTLNINKGLMQIFNGTAMQVQGSGEGYSLASATDLAVGDEGEAFILFGRRAGHELLHLDFRCAPLGEYGLTGIPDEYLPFEATFIDYREGSLYLADSQSMRVLEVSPKGEFRSGFDLKTNLEAKISASLDDPDLRESRRERIRKELEALESAALGGFSIDELGNMYFTVPTLFTACRVSVEGKIESFGTSGGARGKFGVVAGIESDEHGNIYVADRLRCVVLIFDREFNFQTEFGYRGPSRHNLVVPDDLAVDAGSGKVYVSQAANLGISVFRVDFN